MHNLQLAGTRTLVAMFVVAGLLAVPAGASAIEIAESVDARAATFEPAAVDLLHLRNDQPMNLARLNLEATKVEIELHERTEYVARHAIFGDDSVLAVPAEADDEPPQIWRVQDATFSLTNAPDLFTVNAFGESEFMLHGTASGLDIASIRDAQMSHVGISPKRDSTGAAPNEQSGDFGFSRQSVSGDRTLNHAVGEVEVTLTGDLVLELMGPALRVDGRGYKGIIESGFEDRPVAGQSDIVERTTKFLRLRLTDASVFIHAASVNEDFVWVQPESVITSSSLLVADGNALQLDHMYAIAAAGGILAVKSREAPASATVLEASPEVMWALTAATIAILSLAATAWFAFRFSRRTPSMDDVEEAMEAGQYKRAAQLSNRIVTRRPNVQDARLSRAIALSRRGDHAQVIAELEPFLKSTSPKDGTFHYVLGLALLDSGRPSEATKNLREAVRRTPDLAPQVEARIGAPPAPSMDVNGYV